MTGTSPLFKPYADSATAWENRVARTKSRKTLTDQLIGRQIILLAILLLVVGISQYLILRAVLYSSTAHTLTEEISVLTPIIKHSLRERGIAGFTHIANLLVSRLRAPGVEVVITNALGHLIASSPTVHAQVPPLAQGSYFIWHNRVVVDAAIGNNIYYPTGYVWLLSSVNPIHQILRRDAELYVFLAAIALLLSGWLGSLSLRQALRPLQQIRESTQRIASGEFGHVPSMPSAPTEIHDLADAIDTMSDSIQELFLEEKALSDKMRRFVADASHELRTPLTTIRGFLDLMARDELTPEEQARGLKAIQEQARRMGRLVNQLLTLSRMDAAPQAQMTLVPVALDQWLEGLSTELRTLLGSRRLQVVAEPLWVMADVDRLTEVLFNLMDNIRRYTPADIEVSIRVTSEGDQVALDVKDTGPGISASDLPYIFDRLYRGDRARTSASGGTGLGLSIVQSIIHAMHGQISAQRIEPHGTQFHIVLPKAPASSEI